MAAVCLRGLRRQGKRGRLLRMAGAMWFLYLRREHRATRSLLTRPWLLRREELGVFDTLMSEMRDEDQISFFNFLRVTPGLFENLVQKVTPLIQRSDTTFRKAISPGMWLAITMRFLATGDTFKSLSFLFWVANNTIGCIVPETCEALYQVLKDDYFKCPTTAEEWRVVADEYFRQWNFPNCLRSLDGKHVTITKPAASGSKFYNYKHTFSILLLALVDADYKFLFVDVGAQGRCSDAGVLAESYLKDALQNNTIGVPPPAPLPGKDDDFPFCMIGDNAFPLKDYLLKPYPHRNLTASQRIYNCHLSRARRCMENAFGIMAKCFWVFLNPIGLRPEKVDTIIMTCCTLHNMLRTIAPNNYVLSGEEQQSVTRREDTLKAARVNSRRSATKMAKDYRDYLCEYFNSPEGAVSWQNAMV